MVSERPQQGDAFLVNHLTVSPFAVMVVVPAFPELLALPFAVQIFFGLHINVHLGLFVVEKFQACWWWSESKRLGSPCFFFLVFFFWVALGGL
jgi:hypothetical protein